MAVAAGLLSRDKVSAETRAEIDWHAAMKEKYFRAACCPWLLIVPDPPRPGRAR